jgi:hypothetical protein
MINKQSSNRKPAHLLAMVALAAFAALAMFVVRPGGSALAQSVDSSPIGIEVHQSIGGPIGDNSPNVFNVPGDEDCEDDEDDYEPGGSPPPGSSNDDDDEDCEDENDEDDEDCDDNYDGPWSPGGSHDDDECDDDRDHGDRDCDRGRDDNHRGGRDDCDRDHRDRCDDDRDHRDRGYDSRDRHDDDCDEDASITISKDASPSTNETFGFSGDLGSFSLKDGGSKTFKVDRGTYVVHEDSDSDWDLRAIDCSGNGTQITSVSQMKVTIRVGDGDNVRCTFENRGDEPAQVVAPIVAPAPVIIYVPVPAPQPVVRVVEAPRAPEPTRPVQVVAALPRTGEGPATESGSLALPLGIAGASIVVGAGYVAVRRIRDSE